jgi:hypothetical protein
VKKFFAFVVVAGLGFYCFKVYSLVQVIDEMAAQSLKTWSITEALVEATKGGGRLPDCIKAKSEAATLQKAHFAIGKHLQKRDAVHQLSHSARACKLALYGLKFEGPQPRS